MSKQRELKKQKKEMLVERVWQLPTKVARLLSPNLLPQLEPTPQRPIEIARYLLALSTASDRVRNGYIARRLIVVAGLPKSASSNISTCVSEIQRAHGYLNEQERQNNPIPGRRYARYMYPNNISSLRPELLADFVHGGVVKYHPAPDQENLQFLELTGARLVLILRHPADQIAALYCHIMRHFRKYPQEKDRKYTYEHISLIPTSVFTKCDIDEAIRRLIAEEFLLNMLKWCADWLHYRDVKRSYVLRYEDCMTNPRETFDAFSESFFGCPMSEEVWANVQARMVRGDSNDLEMYPRGDTGRIGIWRSYFNSENQKLYNEKIDQYLNAVPGFKSLLDVYPNLYLE